MNVDQLVAAIAATHVGQDALDLAVLHAQLTKALFPNHTCHPTIKTCNTPTGRTRAPSLSSPVHRLPNSPLALDGPWQQPDERDTDEQMVEDVLSSFASQPSSLFTSTDPFYIAQLQAAHHRPTPSSFFAQTGRPPQHSPFLTQSHPDTVFASPVNAAVAFDS